MSRTVAAVLPYQPRPIFAQVSHYGEPGTESELHVISAYWATTQGRACRICPREACTFREQGEGRGLCSVLIRGRVLPEVITGLGLPLPGGTD
jgi:hypothetical protein